MERSYARILCETTHYVIEGRLTHVTHSSQFIDGNTSLGTQLANTADINVIILHTITLIMNATHLRVTFMIRAFFICLTRIRVDILNFA